MTQYRKKPVVIEAVQFDGLNPTEIKEFVGENCEVEIYDNEVTPPVARIFIHTLEGDMEVSKGDYVIRGIKGEFYPCKPDIFEQTYESAETQQEQPEVDLEHIENDAELIANEIMIGVQSSRYHTCVYNTGSNDFNHSHLVQAARKGIELGLKTKK